ncbi:hypothetical protein T4B_13204 [Trichinella pseudospiralis]|uniref:Uncharacterized protein n=1 Tax=Trichinella pseudospiralis TaxID=6337 RepID=A0A0V1JFX8_TRIPS|nr:hypothetical protein T4B_13204 [Trichinella pseudospiralis]KRZ42683.1 hypothetical protein T4C_1176 [Trichinella pseudospiralis]
MNYAHLFSKIITAKNDAQSVVVPEQPGWSSSTFSFSNSLATDNIASLSSKISGYLSYSSKVSSRSKSTNSLLVQFFSVTVHLVQSYFQSFLISAIFTFSRRFQAEQVAIFHRNSGIFVTAEKEQHHFSCIVLQFQCFRSSKAISQTNAQTRVSGNFY